MIIDAEEFNTCPMNPTFDENVILPNDVSFLDYEVSSFPGTEVNMFSRLGCQTPDNMTTAHHGVKEASHFDSIFGAKRDRNFFDAGNDGVRNFQNGLGDETKYNDKPLMDIHRGSADFSLLAPGISQNVDIVQRAYDDQVRVDASPFDSFNRLDGRFLSLGTNSGLDIQSDVCGRKVNHNSARSFSPHGQLANDSLHSLGGRFSEFQNDIGGFMTHHYTDTMSSFCNDHGILQGTTSGFQTSAPLGGEINRQQFIPMPSRTSVYGNELDSRFSSYNSWKGYGANTLVPSNVSGDSLGLPIPLQRMQRIPFDSFVLRSNHQVSNQLQDSYLRTEMANQSGPVLESARTSAAQAAEGHIFFDTPMVRPDGQIYPLNNGHELSSTGEGAAITDKSEFSHPSSTLSRESHKRRLELPPPATAEYQRRKTMPYTSSKAFSPHLVQDALGHTVEPMSPFTGSVNPSLNPPVPAKGSAAYVSSESQTDFFDLSRSSRVPTTRGSTSARPTGSEKLAFCSSTMSFLATLPNISHSPVVASESRTLSPPNIRAPTGLARTVSTHTGLARTHTGVTLNSSRRMIPETSSCSPNIPAHVTAPRRPSSALASLNSPPLSSVRKSFPAMAVAETARVLPDFRAKQVPSSMPRIKCQGSDLPQPSGMKCLLCKRDLSYTPEGPVSIPPIPPPVAVLPCGHTFHDHCLVLITPPDQSKDPPCIPCAMGEK